MIRIPDNPPLDFNDNEEQDVIWTDLDSGLPCSPSYPSRRLTKRPISQLLVQLPTALVLVIIGAVLATSTDARALLAQTFFPPGAPGTPAPGVRFYLHGNPTWGRFTIDGIAIAHLPKPGEPPLMLRPGIHRIVWQAAPFPARICTIAVERTGQVSSPCLTQASVLAAVLPDEQTLQFTFFAQLRDLHEADRASLLNALQATFTPYGGSTGVAAGEAEATGATGPGALPCALIGRIHSCTRRAAGPEVAHLTVQMHTNDQPTDPCVTSLACVLNQQDCRWGCDPWYPEAQPASGWDVVMAVHQSWSYTTPAGQVEASDQPISAIAGMAANDTLIAFHITWESRRWQVALLDHQLGGRYDNPFCGQAVEDVNTLLQARGGDPAGMRMQWVKTAPSLVAQGCLVIVTPTSPTGNGGENTPAWYLIRFGVVLDANQSAERLLPEVPWADAHEQEVATSFASASSVRVTV